MVAGVWGRVIDGEEEEKMSQLSSRPVCRERYLTYLPNRFFYYHMYGMVPTIPTSWLIDRSSA